MAMLAYFIRRLLQAGVSLTVITYVVFFLTTRNGVILLHHLTPTALLPADYLVWLRDILQGKWGYSDITFQPVLQTIGETVPVSLMLIVPALILQETLAIGMGVLLAGALPFLGGSPLHLHHLHFCGNPAVLVGGRGGLFHRRATELVAVSGAHRRVEWARLQHARLLDLFSSAHIPSCA